MEFLNTPYGRVPVGPKDRPNYVNCFFCHSRILEADARKEGFNYKFQKSEDESPKMVPTSSVYYCKDGCPEPEPEILEPEVPEQFREPIKPREDGTTTIEDFC